MQLRKVTYDGTPKSVNAGTRASIRYAIAAGRGAYFTVRHNGGFATIRFGAIRSSGRVIEICRDHGDHFEALPRWCELNWLELAMSPLLSKKDRERVTDLVAEMQGNRIREAVTS